MCLVNFKFANGLYVRLSGETMKNYSSVVTKKLIVAVIATLMLPAGILLIIFGAKRNTLMLVAGIVMTVIGFYGSPMCWIKFGESKKLALVFRLIYSENMYTVDDIATQTTFPREDVTAYINTLISSGYITGFFFKDGKLILNTNKKQTESTSEMIKCPACGGTMRYDGLNYVCEYCGHVESKK